jgi:hypothetical protein
MDTVSLGLNVDSSKIKEATAALDELTAAAERAQAALVSLGVALIVDMADDEEAEGQPN